MTQESGNTNIESSELDFEGIRNKLKTYLEAQSEFADYNFEGSAMANLLDVMAYNTHFNALSANMAINESFLETAQLRGSVVTHAHSLGYYPKSKTASKATVNVTADLTDYIGDRPNQITLPAGQTFAATVEGTVYTFQTLISYTATDDGNGLYTFLDENSDPDLEIHEGEEITRTYRIPDASDRRHYVIDDESLGQDTLQVKVYENFQTESFQIYDNIRNAVRVTNLSRNYILQETPNGFYEVEFTGDADLGISPNPGNKLELIYLKTNGKDANGARIFTPSTSITVDGQSFQLTVVTASNSTGGADKESIESIRFHAPLTYASQRRLITASDYHTLIQSNYTSLEDVAAWGGELNVPIDYGKIFISIKYPDGTTDASKLATENDIVQNLIEPLGAMSIRPEFIDPVLSYIGLRIQCDFNPSKTGLTSQVITGRVRSEVIKYFNDELGVFDSTFRRSNLLTELDELSPAILSTRMDVVMNQRLIPILNLNKSYEIFFPVELQVPDDENYRITSSRFTYDGEVCTFRNKLGSNNIEVVTSTNKVKIDNIGFYDAAIGKINLTTFEPVDIIGGLSYIKVYAIPLNPATISPLRNYILELDLDETDIVINTTYEETRVSL